MVVKVRKPTKAKAVFECLHRDIIAGSFEPGEKLQMETLKQRYGIGFSPLREALSRLASKGLVETEEQCGFRVSPLSLDEFYDIYMLRTHLELLALKLAIKNGDDVWEANILATWHRLSKYVDPKINPEIDPLQWEILQKDFLIALIKACNSPWLFKIRELLYDQSSRYRSLCMLTHHQDKQLRAKYIKDYDRLVEAILARDAEKACKTMRENWEGSIQLTARALTKILS